jgi:hypothetical protein
MKHGTLTVNLDENSPPLRVDFLGRSNDRTPETVLVPFFDELTAKALLKGGAVELHFERLEFFNSSTISTVIQCVMAMRERGVRTDISYDGRQKWQKVFFEALGMLRRGDGNLNVKAV